MGKRSKGSSLVVFRPPTDADGIIEMLRGGGHRITKVRRSLVSIFAVSSRPLSVPELQPLLLQKGLPVNKTTVYRELEFLLSNKIISELDLLDGAKRYELLLPDHHHHHLVCTKCGTIQCVEMHNDLDELEERISQTYQFRVRSHVLEFFGFCSRCG
jgi:Fur family ferric uptake transcriptional regulator